MNLLQQIKNRRLALKIKQHEMPMRIGISRQQYQRLEAKGNPRLDTLTLVAQGLNSEIMLIPKEKMSVVLAALKNSDGNIPTEHQKPNQSLQKITVSEDPWKGLLEDEDEHGN